MGSRHAGNSADLATALVFGRIAGEDAAKYLLKHWGKNRKRCGIGVNCD